MSKTGSQGAETGEKKLKNALNRSEGRQSGCRNQRKEAEKCP